MFLIFYGNLLYKIYQTIVKFQLLYIIQKAQVSNVYLWNEPMKTTQLLKQMIEQEQSVYLDTDAVLNKATQESAEFIEALQTKDTSKIIDEAWDAIGNILSATMRVTNEIPSEFVPNTQTNEIDNIVTFWKRNDGIQALRRIYIRNNKNISLSQVQDLTKRYVQWVLWMASPYDWWMTIDKYLERNIVKMQGRMNMYLPEINLENYIRNVPDFPLPGIQFKDISPMIKSPQALDYVTRIIVEKCRYADVIMGLDARWFIFWPLVAQKLNKPFIMARKPWKLPGDTFDIMYDLEYKKWQWLSIQKDAIQPWQKVAIVDDLLATWGSANAAWELVKKAWWVIEWNYFVIELDELQWRQKLESKVDAILHY